MDGNSDRDFYFGFRFISSLYKLTPLLYPGWSYSLWLTLLLFTLSGSNEVIAYHTGTITGNFLKTLIGHNETEFWKVFYKASLIYVGQTLVIAFVSLTSWLLSVSLRKNLVSRIHKYYFRRHVYFNINTIGDVDNPDQRITQDAEKFTTLLATKVLPYLVISPGVIAYYTYVTWQQAGGIGVGCIYGYFLIGSVVNRIIVSPITKWTARLEKAEGDFRFKHVSVRANCEESAFYEAHEFEHLEANRFLHTLLKIQRKLVLWKFPAQYFQNFFDYYGGVLTYAIQVIPIFLLNSYSGWTPEDLAQQISNNAFYFMYLINSFTRLTDLAMNFGEIAGYTQRLSELVEKTKNVDVDRWITTVSDGENDNHGLFQVQNLTVYPPTGGKRCLISDMSLTISSMKTMLITGVSGIGKTSLFRILKQLWSPTSGNVERFVDSDQVMFLPQKCYFPIGNLSLKDQLVFPQDATCCLYDDSAIIKLLDSLSLNRLLSFCGSLDEPVDFEWQETLSPGEQQRLSIARVLLRRPKVVILDEATSSLGEDMERHIYQLLKSNNVFYISIGHRSSLFPLHQIQLHMTGTDCWEIRDIPTNEKSLFRS